MAAEPEPGEVVPDAKSPEVVLTNHAMLLMAKLAKKFKVRHGIAVARSCEGGVCGVRLFLLTAKDALDAWTVFVHLEQFESKNLVPKALGYFYQVKTLPRESP